MHLMRARQQLLAFLLRHGRSYTTGNHWTQRHRCWLAGQTFKEQATVLSFRIIWRPFRLRRIEEMPSFRGSLRWLRRGRLDRFEARRGLCLIDLVSAATFIASTGDLSRFESPRLLMGYLGLVPSEHSSGGTIRRGGITKTGNREARRMLIEAAHREGEAEILVRLPKNIRDIAWKAQTRLCARYRSLIAKGKKPTVVVAAIARELAGFIWPSLRRWGLR